MAEAPPVPPAAPAERPPIGRARRIWVWVILVVATLLLIASTLTIWVKREALDSNNWADTSGELLQNDQVRGALAQYLVDQVYANVNVAAQLRQRLPEQAQALAAPLATGLQEVAVRAADALLARPRVQALWKEVNRRAVRDLVAILDGKTVRGVKAENGEVVLDLQPLVQNISGRLGVLANRLPPDAGRLVLLKSSQVKAAQNGLKALRVLSVFLLILVLALFTLAVFLAAGRRRVILRAIGWALVISAIVLLVVRRVAGKELVNALTTDEFRPAANTSWLIATDLLRDLAILILVLGLLVVVAVWLAGPTRPAVAVRRVLAPWFRHRPVVVFGAVVVIFLLVILWGPSAGGRSLWGVLILFGLVMAGTEVLRRQCLREFPEDVPPGEGLRAAWGRLTSRGAGGEAPPADPEDAQLGRLERLTRLRDQGALSPEEFEAQKTAILSGRPAS